MADVNIEIKKPSHDLPPRLLGLCIHCLTLTALM
jgi:hypothetical protein